MFAHEHAQLSKLGARKPAIKLPVLPYAIDIHVHAMVYPNHIFFHFYDITTVMLLSNHTDLKWSHFDNSQMPKIAPEFLSLPPFTPFTCIFLIFAVMHLYQSDPSFLKYKYFIISIVKISIQNLRPRPWVKVGPTSHRLISAGARYPSLWSCVSLTPPGAHLNTKIPSSQYTDPDIKDKTVSRLGLSLTWE